MGYTALLFCPDEKTARTVTQVFSELEFTVEACTEPFAAVKKLMGQHFDAVVVDCDQEQNATLLFKSARNSTANQTSLAVAVVEGQAGVAKAFRIGANLVLTKPINIEQTKGTLRVARGLLRKSDPVKPGTPATTPASAEAPSRPAIQRLPEPKIIAPASSAPSFVSRPVAAASVSKPAQKQAQDDDLLGIEGDQPEVRPAAASRGIAGTSRVPASEAKPAFGQASPSLGRSGAASAPAPAREPVKEAPVIATPEKSAESAPLHTTSGVVSAPTFGYGSGSTNASSGGAKKIVIGVAAGIILAGGAFAAWSHFHGAANQSANSTSVSAPASTESQPSSQPVHSSERKPSPSQASASPLTSSPAEPKSHNEESASEEAPASRPVKNTPSTSKPETETKSVAESKSTDENAAAAEEQPLIVKGGKVTPKSKPVATDDSAPSMIGMAAPGAGTPPPNFISSEETGVQPKLQTLNISQGVSQGLVLKKVSPVYPANAIRMRIEGTVELMATISKSGEITHIKILSGDGQLTKAAVDAVKQWKYKPYLLNGEPVEIQTQVTVNFRLPH